MRTLLSSTPLFLLGLLTLPACDGTGTEPLIEAGDANASMHAAPGAAVAIPFSATLMDDDPCTDVVDPNEHQVTFAGTLYLHALPNGNTVIRRESTITTTSGYEGHGKVVEVANGSIYRGHFNDMVKHPDGRQFRAHAVQVVDLKTDPPTIRVLKVHPLTCVKK